MKLGRFWWSLVHRFLNKFAAKSCKRFPPYWIVSLHYLVKLIEMFIKHMPLRWIVTEKYYRIYLTSTVAPKFVRCESSCLQHVGNIATACVQNTHHWSGRTETATENEGHKLDHVVIVTAISHLSVASLIAPDHWSAFCTPSLAIFFIFWIQIWRIWRSQMR